jgi:hypothetical protein
MTIEAIGVFEGFGRAGSESTNAQSENEQWEKEHRTSNIEH